MKLKVFSQRFLVLEFFLGFWFSALKTQFF